MVLKKGDIVYAGESRGVVSHVRTVNGRHRVSVTFDEPKKKASFEERAPGLWREINCAYGARYLESPEEHSARVLWEEIAKRLQTLAARVRERQIPVEQGERLRDVLAAFGAFYDE